MAKSPSERKAMQRRLNAAGVIHAAGWIKKDDAQSFVEMLARAEPVIKAAEDD